MTNSINNGQTIVYKIILSGFKYHIKKGKFEKNSTISKNTHPLKEVEKIKKELIEQKKVKDLGKYYVLKESVNIGSLMAYNLHCRYS